MSQAGRLLLATPLIGDPNFERTVILLLAHGADGAFGVVLNRPSDTRVHHVAEEWADHVTAPGVVFVGGPVGADAVLGLGRDGSDPRAGFERLVGDVGTIDLHAPPPDGERPWLGLRLFAGSAGWAPGQLEDELAEGAWWLADALVDDVLTSDPAGLWVRILRRQPGQVAWFANHPSDPTAN